VVNNSIREETQMKCPKCGGDKAKCSCGGYVKKKGMAKGGYAKYNKGGYAKCGASNPPSKKR
jgi:hypothetical protein